MGKSVIKTLDIHHGDSEKVMQKDLLKTQENVKKVLSDISYETRPHISAELLEEQGDGDDISLTAAVENLIVHGLGRAVRGWWIADKTSPAIIWRVASPTTDGYDSTIHLVLACTENVNIKLLVY